MVDKVVFFTRVKNTTGDHARTGYKISEHVHKLLHKCPAIKNFDLPYFLNYPVHYKSERQRKSYITHPASTWFHVLMWLQQKEIENDKKTSK